MVVDVFINYVSIDWAYMFDFVTEFSFDAFIDSWFDYWTVCFFIAATHIRIHSWHTKISFKHYFSPLSNL